MLIDQHLHFPLASKPCAFHVQFEITKQISGQQQVIKPKNYTLSIIFLHCVHSNPLVLIFGSWFFSS